MKALRSSLTTFVLVLLAALLLGASEASASAFLWVPTGSGDFDVVANWADKNNGNPPPQPPGGGSEGIFHDTQDNILVFNGGTCNMSVTEDLRGARVGANNSGSPATGTLNILPGAVWTADGPYNGVIGSYGGNGTVNQTGGSAIWHGLTIGDEWNWAGNNGVGLYAISGGSLTALNDLAVGDNNGTGSGTFKMVGSGPTSIDANRFIFQSPGVLDVTLDAGGVTTANSTGEAVFKAGSLLRLTPAPGTPAGTYTAMTYGSLNATHQNLSLAPGTNTDRWSLSLGPTALTVTNAYPASLWLVDNFNDNLLDSVRWVALDPEDFDVTGTSFPGGARVEEVNGRIEIDNRGHLRTAQEFNPADFVGALRIRGEASWPATNGGDQFHLIVRGSGEPNDRLGAATDGIDVFVKNLGQDVIIAARSTGPQGDGTPTFDITNEVVTNNLSVSAGDVFDFTLMDNGTSLSFSFVEQGDPSSFATVTADVTDLLGGARNHFIHFYNRENRGGTQTLYLDNISIDVLPEPHSAVLLAAGAVSLLLSLRRRRRR